MAPFAGGLQDLAQCGVLKMETLMRQAKLRIGRIAGVF
jgi:hypothetical protein